MAHVEEKTTFGKHIRPPPYPVINGAPTTLAILKNMNGRDWAGIALYTTIGFAIGCGTRPLRRYNAMFTSFLGFSIEGYLAFGNSYRRLGGYEYNETECARAGVEFTKQPWAQA